MLLLSVEQIKRMVLMRDFNSLQVFLVLMQTRSTQRTAKKLGRSQSYVSKVLAQLREELDDALFVRSAEGLIPTSYAMSVEPKLRNAFAQVQHALNPEEFDPRNVHKVVLHIIEPYLVEAGKEIIEVIREETNALIEIRAWNKLSLPMIEDEEVDLGIHILSTKSQVFYQKKIHSIGAEFRGNLQGEYVKYLVSGVNDYTNYYQQVDPNVEASIFVDNYDLMNQLMDSCYTLRYRSDEEQSELPSVSLDVALIVKSSKRNSPKSKWLMSLIEPIIRREHI